jgi:hypothetical protein
MAASLPPVIITSACPVWITLKASPMALVAEAQAVAMAEAGPRRPKWIETWPLPALTISLGIVNGLILEGPFSSIVACWASNSCRPPMPEPMKTPQRSGGSASNSMPASATADWLAASANCAKRSSRRASLEPNRASGWKSWTCPPKWTLKWVVSNSVKGPTPLLPSQRFDQ